MGLSKLREHGIVKLMLIFCKDGFERSDNESILYLKKEGKVDFLVVCFYVDNMIYFGSNEHLLAHIKSFMMKKFDLTYLGLLQYFLELEVK